MIDSSKSIKPRKVVIFLYNRLFDPLIQSNFWLFINDYLQNERSGIKFYLITYEDGRFPLTEEQQNMLLKWKGQGLRWKKLHWNPGTSYKAKALDILQGFFFLLVLRCKGYKHVISLASVAGTFVYLYSLLLRIRFFLYSFEPHSEYAIDNKMWKKESLQFKLSNYLEKKAASKAAVIASGTRFMEDRIKKEWRYKAAFFKLPTVVNDKKFTFNPEDRAYLRENLSLSETDNVLFYPGKFGDLYYREEVAFMFKWLKEEISDLHFLIVTPHEDEEVISLFNKAKVSPSDYTIRHSTYENIHQYFSASDFALIAVPPGPSKKFISNIKVGEYLCAGLPFLITEGVSEDYLYAIEKKVGVVVKDFKKRDIKSAVPQIKEYLQRDKHILRDHCRTVGLEYRGFHKLNSIFKEAMEVLTLE